MAGALANSLRLAKAGAVLAQHGVRFVPKGITPPLPLRLARILTAPLRLFAVLGRDGRRLGYAFLPGGQTLRLLHFTRGIYTFDLSPGG